MEQIFIDEIQIALKHAMQKLNKKVFSILETNRKKHFFVLCEDGTRIYFMFKREKFHKWLVLFPLLKEIESDVCYVDSINVSLYYSATEKYFNNSRANGFFVICYQDGAILKINYKEWLKRANQYKLYRRINRLNFKKKGDYTKEDEYLEEKTMSCYFTKEEII